MRRIPACSLAVSLCVCALSLGAVAVSSAAEAFKEAPTLAALVAAGNLPPVDKRLPRAPVRVIPIENSGIYGGAWRRAYVGSSDLIAAASRILYEPLVRWGPDFKVHPNLARKWEADDDGKVWTFHLVEGIRWSDGEPFTADDILFYFEDILFRKDITPAIPKWLCPSGRPPAVDKINDYTVRFTFDVPYSLFIEQLACPHGMELVTKPRHYLKTFHERYAKPEELARLVKSRGAGSWQEMFRSVGGSASATLFNPQAPSLCAWITIVPPRTETVVWERNPFYWKVDDRGNQLPYIEKIVHERAVNSQAVVRKAVAGEIDMQGRRLGGASATKALLEGAKGGGYRLIPVCSTASVGALMAPNSNHKDPQMRRIFSDRRFRIALSHAVDRNAINKRVFRGRGIPRQAAPLKRSRFYRPSYESAYTLYDPAIAKRLLDEVGIKEGDNDKRMRLDGKTLKIVLRAPSNVQTWVDAAGIIASNLCDIGIEATVEAEDMTTFRQRVREAEHDVALWSGDGGVQCLLDPRWYFPYSEDSFQAPLYGRWYQTGGVRGEEPPADIKELMELYDRILKSPSLKTQEELFSQILEANERNLWVIGLVLNPPSYYVVQEDFFNVRAFDYEGWTYPNPGPIHPEQFYMAH